MSTTVKIIVIAVAVVLVAFISSYRLIPRRLKVKYFQRKWIDLQQLCKNKATWTDAIVSADKLLDEALKKKRYGGKSMGERLVAAQRKLTDNDSVWFGHKLRNKIDTDPKIKLRERDVKNALLGIRQALKDIGALPDGKSKD